MNLHTLLIKKWETDIDILDESIDIRLWKSVSVEDGKYSRISQVIVSDLHSNLILMAN